MSCFDEVIYFENGINTQFFDPLSSETTKSLYKDDSNSLLSFAGLVSFFPVPSAEVDSKRKKKVQQECVSLIAQLIA